MGHSLKLRLSQIEIWKRIAMGMTKVYFVKRMDYGTSRLEPSTLIDQVILWWPKYWVVLQFHETEWELWRLPGNLECRGHFLSGSFGSIVIMWDIVKIQWLDESWTTNIWVYDGYIWVGAWSLSQTCMYWYVWIMISYIYMDMHWFVYIEKRLMYICALWYI